MLAYALLMQYLEVRVFALADVLVNGGYGARAGWITGG